MKKEKNAAGAITNAAAISEWKKNDVIARNYLYATIDNARQSSLINCSTSFEMWTRLASQHLQNSVHDQHAQQTRFFDYKFKPDHDIMTHVTEIEGMAKHLSDIGAPVTTLQVMAKVISTLPPSFRNFISAWDSVPTDDRTMSILTSRLLKEEGMNKLWGGTETKTMDQAFYSTDHTQAGKSNSGGSHKWHSQDLKDKGSKKAKRIVCNYCGIAWHVEKVCRRRIRDEANARGRSTAAANSATANPDTKLEDQDYAYTASLCFLARKPSDWFADCAATHHMTDQKDTVTNYKPITPGTWMVKGISDSVIPAHGQGDVQITTTFQGVQRNRIIKNVLYVPGLGANLFSVGSATDAQGVGVEFWGEQVIFTRNGVTEMTGKRVGKSLYYLDIRVHHFNSSCTEETAMMGSATLSQDIWHQRLAHVNQNTVNKMLSQQLVDGLHMNSEKNSKTVCSGCAYGKMHRLPFPTGRTRANQVGQLIHSDVCGPMQTSTPGGARYFISFKDDFSGWRVVYFLKNKSEVEDYFKKYVNQLRGETGNHVNTLRSDNGGEFMGQSFQIWLQHKGIRHETSVPHTPEQNGVAERSNRTVVEAARSMLHQKNLPLELWAEAINCAVYTLNRVLSSSTSVTPYQAWHRAKPDVSNLRVFGSIAFVHIPKVERQKLDKKSLKCVFVGYSETQKGYRFWDPTSRKIKISRDALFDEDDCIDAQELSNDDDHFDILEEDALFRTSKENIQEHTSSTQTDGKAPDEVVEQPALPVSMETDEAGVIGDIPTETSEQVTRRYPLRVREPKKIWPALQSVVSSYVELYEPTDFKDAISSPEAHLWREAVNEEYASLMKNETWSLVHLPPGRTAIKSRWVFKVKPGISGSATRHKARLVAKGYTQRPGIDYADTYSPVAKHDSLRTVLSISAAQDLEMLQLDIKTAFLYGDLEEEIYLEQPEGFVAAGQEEKVCKLRKCIYGLKQASRVWNRTFDDFLLRFGLSRSTTDPCIYFRRHEETFVVVAIWVDDGLVCANNNEIISSMYAYLNTHFDMRSAPATNFVGLEILRDRPHRKLYVSQQRYITKILHKFGMSECNAKKIPADPNARLTTNQDHSTQILEDVPYREAIGSLMYLMLASRPDIAFAVNQVAQFCERPEASHWAAVKRIFAYLKGTSNYGLCFGETKLKKLIGFTDSDYAGDLTTRRSTSGFVFLLNGGPVAWSSRRQTCVALSTTEAEYMAACEAAKEAVWMRRFLNEIKEEPTGPISVYCDNQSAIKLVHNPEFHQRTKHVDVKFHFIRDQQEKGDIDVSYVETENQLADIFTKPLPEPRFVKLRREINVISIQMLKCD